MANSFLFYTSLFALLALALANYEDEQGFIYTKPSNRDVYYKTYNQGQTKNVPKIQFATRKIVGGTRQINPDAENVSDNPDAEMLGPEYSKYISSPGVDHMEMRQPAESTTVSIEKALGYHKIIEKLLQQDN